VSAKWSRFEPGTTGEFEARVWQCELSTVDSAFLLAGALTSGIYFDAKTATSMKSAPSPTHSIGTAVLERNVYSVLLAANGQEAQVYDLCETLVNFVASVSKLQSA